MDIDQNFPTSLWVSGEFRLDEDDKQNLRDFYSELIDDGVPVAAAFEGACLQVAQDRLGNTGFVVEEIEPL